MLHYFFLIFVLVLISGIAAFIRYRYLKLLRALVKELEYYKKENKRYFNCEFIIKQRYRRKVRILHHILDLMNTTNINNQQETKATIKYIVGLLTQHLKQEQKNNYEN